MVEAPRTEEGWFSLHDFRSIDWDAWRDAPERERRRAVEEGAAFMQRREAVADADAGESALFSVLGHKADLLCLHFRPTLDELSTIERRFEDTALAKFTERTTSYLSVTEVSGYVSDDYFEDPDAVNEGTRRYIEGKLTPEVPDDEYVCFYPMSKRRGPEHNWYDLEFEERAELMAGHGEVGKEYAGKITQVIASSVGLDAHEWGVTLFGADPTDIKDIVYEMRFDPASSRYGEFGDFYVGRRFPPHDLDAFLDGRTVPTGRSAVNDVDSASTDRVGDGRDGRAAGDDGGRSHGSGGTERSGAGGGSAHGDHPHGETGAAGDGDHPHGGAGGGDSSDADIRGELADLDIYAGQPHGEDVHATVLYSEADVDELSGEVDGLRGNFDHYATHVKTAVYAGRHTDRAAVVSIWDTASAAETAAGFLADLPDVVARAGEESGFGTMGMFYTVKPDYRSEFVDAFDEVSELLAETDGHVETDLMVNVGDGHDMFIASQWNAKEDAMTFFGSDEFRETVQWGREVLADRPRHVFLA